MPNTRLDYIWLDGYQPTANIRTKSQTLGADPYQVVHRIMETVKIAHPQALEAIG